MYNIIVHNIVAVSFVTYVVGFFDAGKKKITFEYLQHELYSGHTLITTCIYVHATVIKN